MSDIIFRKQITITDAFRDLFKRQRYEDYVLMIINKSERLFKDKRYTKIQRQSNGESVLLTSMGTSWKLSLQLIKSKN